MRRLGDVYYRLQDENGLTAEQRQARNTPYTPSEYKGPGPISSFIQTVGDVTRKIGEISRSIPLTPLQFAEKALEADEETY